MIGCNILTECISAAVLLAFDEGSTTSGSSSYQELAAELQRVENPKRILDLACADGHLIHSIRQVADSFLERS